MVIVRQKLHNITAIHDILRIFERCLDIFPQNYVLSTPVVQTRRYSDNIGCRIELKGLSGELLGVRLRHM